MEPILCQMKIIIKENKQLTLVGHEIGDEQCLVV